MNDLVFKNKNNNKQIEIMKTFFKKFDFLFGNLLKSSIKDMKVCIWSKCQPFNVKSKYVIFWSS